MLLIVTDTHLYNALLIVNAVFKKCCVLISRSCAIFLLPYFCEQEIYIFLLLDFALYQNFARFPLQTSADT